MFRRSKTPIPQLQKIHISLNKNLREIVTKIFLLIDGGNRSIIIPRYTRKVFKSINFVPDIMFRK